ncbi:intermembrane transport protein PqiB [Spongorhabdus nitratireducens]
MSNIEVDEPQARIVTGQRFSTLWVLPLIALIIAGWMVWHHYSTLGPRITIRFESAEGIEAGKTVVKYRNVVVGDVIQVQLTPDLEGVVTTVQMTAAGQDLLHDESQFWVVRPRVTAEGVSGLGTLLSGAYIEINPGKGPFSVKAFTGNEKPPVAAPDAPGLRVDLYSQRANSLNVGDPVLYSGFTVGRLESIDFDLKTRKVRYQLFINAPYNQLVTNQTRFWNASGIELKAGSAGFELKTGSLASLLSGGIAFTTPPDAPPGKEVQDYHSFQLFDDFSSIREAGSWQGFNYLLLVDASVRGLQPGATVEFRGIQVGVVRRIAIDLISEGMDETNSAIPVLVTIQPGRMAPDGEQLSMTEMNKYIASSVKAGLRASLKSGNLLTGSLYVDLDYYADAGDSNGTLNEYRGYTVLPTIKGGLGHITEQVNSLLTKLNKLPLDKTVTGLNQTLTSADKSLNQVTVTVKKLETLLADIQEKQLPEELQQTLGTLQGTLDDYSAEGELYSELQATMAQLKLMIWQLQPLVRQLNEKPDSLVFGRDPAPEHKESVQ